MFVKGFDKNFFMFLFLSQDKTIHEVQHNFSSRYPFLKLEFYKTDHTDPELTVKKHLSHLLTLKSAGLKNDGILNIHDELSVADLGNLLRKFGLNAQVSRRSGILWLETTMTDTWSLQKQNEHGREITLLAVKQIIGGEENETGPL